MDIESKMLVIYVQYNLRRQEKLSIFTRLDNY